MSWRSVLQPEGWKWLEIYVVGWGLIPLPWYLSDNTCSEHWTGLKTNLLHHMVLIYRLTRIILDLSSRAKSWTRQTVSKWAKNGSSLGWIWYQGTFVIFYPSRLNVHDILGWKNKSGGCFFYIKQEHKLNASLQN